MADNFHLTPTPPGDIDASTQGTHGTARKTIQDAKPPSVSSRMVEMHARLDILREVCIALVSADVKPLQRAKLLGKLAILTNDHDADTEPSDGS